MTNRKQKGSRVEREVAHWLQENNFVSARRSQQYNGVGGLSDIICEELPDWHIEVKGTKSGVLSRNQLLKWYEQVERDCPENMYSVILNKANAWELVALVPFTTWKKLRQSRPCTFNVRIEVKDSLEAAKELLAIQAVREVELYTGLHAATESIRVIEGIYYGIAPDKVLVAMLAVTWLSLLERKPCDKLS